MTSGRDPRRGAGTRGARGFLALALVDAVRVDVVTTASTRELAIAGAPARRAADALRGPRTRGRGEGAAALGASAADAHPPSVAGAPEVAAFSAAAPGWITIAPRAAGQAAARWISKAPEGGSEVGRR